MRRRNEQGDGGRGTGGGDRMLRDRAVVVAVAALVVAVTANERLRAATLATAGEAVAVTAAD